MKRVLVQRGPRKMSQHLSQSVKPAICYITKSESKIMIFVKVQTNFAIFKTKSFLFSKVKKLKKSKVNFGQIMQKHLNSHHDFLVWVVVESTADVGN